MCRIEVLHPDWLQELEGVVYWLTLEGSYCGCGPFPVLRIHSRETRRAKIYALAADTETNFPRYILSEQTISQIRALIMAAMHGAQLLVNHNLRLFVPSSPGKRIEPIVAKAVKALAIIGGDNSVPLPASVNIGRHGGIDDQRSLAQFLKELKSEGGTMTDRKNRQLSQYLSDHELYGEVGPEAEYSAEAFGFKTRALAEAFAAGVYLLASSKDFRGNYTLGVKIEEAPQPEFRFKVVVTRKFKN